NNIKLRVVGNGNTITDNVISGGVNHGISAAGSNAVISGNNISGLNGTSGVGIIITGLSYSLINNNTVENVYEYGIYGEQNTTHDNAIIDNAISYIGIVGEDSNGAGTGIKFSCGPNHTLVANNELAGCLGYGICMVGNATYDAPFSYVIGNTVITSGDPGMLIGGASDALISKNTVNDNRSVGIAVGSHSGLPITSPRAKVINNTACGNDLEGIYLTGAEDGIITGNITLNNYTSANTYASHKRAGIGSYYDSNTDNMLLCNTSSDNDSGDQKYGVYLCSGVTYNTVMFNDLYYCPDASVQNDSGNGTNTISSNRSTVDWNALSTAPPVAVADTDNPVLLSNGSGQLDGSDTHLMTGSTTISYLWEQIYGPTISITNPSAAITGFTAPTVTTVELLGFRLTATTDDGSTSDEIYFAVMPKYR
ncbi:MAG: right-handed parallel beta-helix repeat-containing protein, partial [bacterium]|nr:right-handed parallel beta-helix repeat-containing protein [bacterium]